MSTDRSKNELFEENDEIEPPVTIPPTPEEYDTLAHQDDEEFDEMTSTAPEFAEASNE